MAGFCRRASSSASRPAPLGQTITMKKLYLLRHAKSSWEASDVPDHDRPLAARGERAALLMGRYMAQERLVPDLILCSTALRSVQTRELAAEQWPVSPPTEFDRSLYLNGKRAILQRLAKVGDEVGSVLVIGHNPDLQDLTLALSSPGNGTLRLQAQAKFPSGALAVLHLPIHHWSEVLHTHGSLVDLAMPKELV